MVYTPKEKNIRLERHSAGKTQAYGDSSVRAGTGKFNWGNKTTDATAADCNPMDKKDPMYDSEIEITNKDEKKIK
ncbi:hypothetical protein, conserved [Plasmodium gonderi]|uniref:Hyaluronan/mRNA-binding protein domain-containing protein n=1 Tax=Plasmodium gonderi TaxID=77519 RepID=A0A1Y1JMA5_PLAGO|nr:hypothetical protein, conserved [Plasmodium gonderi]GAW83726.1 hypothetical protein, conserved [Plasmodium gonderi]